LKKCNDNIEKAIKEAIKLLELADEGDEAREDDGCGVLFGTVRDCAYSIKTSAETEKEKHIKTGRWD
jgi:hypothetical protein